MDANTPLEQTPHQPRHNLVMPLTPLIGRDAELTTLVERLHDPTCRLVTISGTGGVGKTRLALQVAHAFVAEDSTATPFPHGIFLVPFASIEPRTPLDELLATTIASALELSLTGTEPVLQQVGQFLREKTMLLLLDSIEHLANIAPFVTYLLEVAPHVVILTTTRSRLQMQGEWLMPLEGLAVPAIHQDATLPQVAQSNAVQLFLHLAQAQQPDFALTTAVVPDVLRICHLLEGNPLGLELASNWLTVLSCREIADELEQNLDLLTSSAHNLPERQHSLRAVFNSSWALLTDAEQQGLARLAVFPGSFTREAAQSIADTGLPLLAALMHKSLVRRVTTGSATRYGVLKSVRHYAAEHLERLGQTDALVARHTTYYLDLVAAHLHDLRGAAQQTALVRFDAELHQIRAAWSRAVAAADATSIARAAPALFHLYDVRSWFSEGVTVFAEAGVALSGNQAVGGLAERQAGSTPAATLDSDTAVAYGIVLARQGWFTFHLGRQSEARALLEQSLEILHAHNAHAEQIFPYNYLAAVCTYLGDYAAAQRYGQAGLQLAQEIGDAYSEAVVCNILGQSAYDQQDHQAARQWSERSLTIEQQLGNRWSMAYSLTNLGKVAAALGEHHTARDYFSQSLAIRQELRDARGVAICFNRLGDAAASLGMLDEAENRYTQSLELFREIGNRSGMAAALINLGRLRLNHDAPAGMEALHEALRLAIETQSLPQIVNIVALCAPLVRQQGHRAWANQLDRLSHETPGDTAAYQEQIERLLAWTQEPHTSLAAPPVSEHPAYPAGLTPREVEVLRLVAQGLTYAQIAEQLVVSQRTVSTHLTSIYGKLGVNSRSAATRFAIEQGLA